MTGAGARWRLRRARVGVAAGGPSRTWAPGCSVNPAGAAPSERSPAGVALPRVARLAGCSAAVRARRGEPAESRGAASAVCRLLDPALGVSAGAIPAIPCSCACGVAEPPRVAERPRVARRSLPWVWAALRAGGSAAGAADVGSALTLRPLRRGDEGAEAGPAGRVTPRTCRLSRFEVWKTPAWK